MYLAAAAASMPWCGHAACSGTTTAGQKTEPRVGPSPTVLPVFKSQEDWEGGANAWRGAGGPIHIRRPKNPHPTAPAFIDAAREMGIPILDDVNGPMVPGAGYININIAAHGTRVSAVDAFLRPALSRPNLTLLLNATVVKLNFKGTRCVGSRS
jgi:choline dehydrogenase